MDPWDDRSGEDARVLSERGPSTRGIARKPDSDPNQVGGESGNAGIITAQGRVVHIILPLIGPGPIIRGWVVDLLEQVIATSTLSIASLYDIRYREVPDWIWVLGAVGGVILRLLNPEETLAYVERAWLPLLALALMLAAEWFLSTSGEADVLAYATLALISTEPPLILPPPFLVYLLSKVLLLTVLPLQLMINLVRVRRNPDLLRGFDEPLHRKILALILLSPYSKHLAVGARVAEVRSNGRRKFLLRAALSSLGESEIGEEGVWIAPTYPFIPFILAAYVTIQLLSPVLP